MSIENRIYDLAHEISAAMVREKEATLHSILIVVVGLHWRHIDLTGRLLMKKYPNGMEILCIDGIDRAVLYPPRFEQVRENETVKIKAIQEYRLIVQPSMEVK